MMDSYITVQGETWDLIAFKIWGSEYLFPLLLEVNSQYRHIVIFSGGIELKVPEIDTSLYVERPSWLEEDEEL